MTVFSARRTIPNQRALPTAVDQPRPPVTESPPLDAVRPAPFEWARRRRADRATRRIEAAGARAVQRLDHLGSAWHVVDWPRTDLPGVGLVGLDPTSRDERAGFLAIGPSGVFAVSVADQGRTRVLIAGDVVQIDGRRPAYVAQARRDAKRASKALSAAVGLNVPVVPVLAFVGSGLLSIQGLPKECLVATHHDLDHLLVACGARISAETAEKLSRIARQPTTWMNASSHSATNYRWYEEGRTATDKRARQR